MDRWTVGRSCNARTHAHTHARTHTRTHGRRSQRTRPAPSPPQIVATPGNGSAYLPARTHNSISIANYCTGACPRCLALIGPWFCIGHHGGRRRVADSRRRDVLVDDSLHRRENVQVIGRPCLYPECNAQTNVRRDRGVGVRQAEISRAFYSARDAMFDAR